MDEPDGNLATIEPPEEEDIGPGPASAPNPLLLGIGRILVSIAIPVLAFGSLIWAFNYLRDSGAPRINIVVVSLVVGVLGVFALYWGMDRIISLFPPLWARRLRPFAFVGPALFILVVYLIYPAIRTVWLSFYDANSANFVGLDNYQFVFGDASMLRAIRNTVAWIVLVPLSAVGLGLGFAVLADKLKRTEALAKSIIFLPMAISFVGAAIVWRFVYSFRPQGFGEQIGLLNGLLVAVGGEPQSWLLMQPWNNLFLIVIMVWLQTGFAMVILSAAIKGVPDDILEAARIDGARETQVFWRVIVPNIASSVVVVLTTMVINVLKIFDIVYVMTGGNFGTEIIAQQMVSEFFDNRHSGRGAAIAIFMFVAVLPILILNIRRFRAEEATR